jgi:hypothetical protein
MRYVMFAAVAAMLALGASAAHAECMPLKSDVVSLGEKAARFYSERSLKNAVEDEQRHMVATGLATGRVVKAMDCKPYPNLIGADEWRCQGEATVCSK